MPRLLIAAALAVAVVFQAAIAAAAPATAFNYQGRLTEAGELVTGLFDFRFSLFTAVSGGTALEVIERPDVQVEEGGFTVSLDFGSTPWTGEPRWLQTEVRPAGSSDPYTLLSPRIQVLPSPYAISSQKITLPSTSEASVPGAGALKIVNTDTTGDSWAVEGESRSPEGRGVYGRASTSTGPNYGGFFRSDSPEGQGVLGWSTPGSGSGYGVWGLAAGSNATAVFGWASSQAGAADGVYGRTDSPAGIGVYGLATSTTGENIGVFGETPSTIGTGVFGNAPAATGPAYGVFGSSSSSEGIGAYGYSSIGVAGARGVMGIASGRRPSNFGAGVWGDSGDGEGVVGTSETNTGVVGASDDGVGVYGYSDESDGVVGEAYASTRAGVFGYNPNNWGYGMYSDGNFAATGSKNFQIDHPLDPENKYLNHFSAEGPDPLLLYRGNVTLDREGKADVELPDYFESLNRDFHYLLTPVGSPMPDLHVSGTVQENRFRVAGGTPGGTVSWMVSGIRNDPGLRDNLLPVEQDKPARERGRFVHPEAYGRTRLESVFQERTPKVTRQHQ